MEEIKALSMLKHCLPESSPPFVLASSILFQIWRSNDVLEYLCEYDVWIHTQHPKGLELTVTPINVEQARIVYDAFCKQEGWGQPGGGICSQL